MTLPTSDSSRRTFLTTATAALTVAPKISAGAYAGGSDLLKIGLVGCGGRGTGAASQALKADSGVELYAMADVFLDRLDMSRANLERNFNKDDQNRVNVPEERRFTGFDAYRQVIDNVDVVLLTSTPHFRPRHLKAAVEAGKHVFCEKPVAVDAPGVRSVMESVELARRNKTSIVSGLCWRYHHGKRAVFDQIQKEGLIGDIVSMQCSYMTGGVWDPRKTREECDSEMEHQIRNWYYYTWLSGDFNVEQHIHSLDKMMWAMGDKPPSTISASGGRQVRTDAKYGNIYDHFNVVYEWENEVTTGRGDKAKTQSRPGVKAFARCRHWKGCENDVNDFIVGTKGRADVMKHKIYDLEGNEIWKFEGEGGDMYQIEHDELFAGIRGANPINNGDYMCTSTMMAIAGRMAAYTGQQLTWDQVLNSQEDLTPTAYEWGDIPVPPVAVPGKTKFV